jgi:hypothetical protein
VREEAIAGTPNLDTAVSSSRMRQPRARCDRVVAWVIMPFLMLAFAVLYQLPDVSGRLFAWHIHRVRPAHAADGARLRHKRNNEPARTVVIGS